MNLQLNSTMVHITRVLASSIIFWLGLPPTLKDLSYYKVEGLISQTDFSFPWLIHTKMQQRSTLMCVSWSLRCTLFLRPTWISMVWILESCKIRKELIMSSFLSGVMKIHIFSYTTCGSHSRKNTATVRFITGLTLYSVISKKAKRQSRH